MQIGKGRKAGLDCRRERCEVGEARGCVGLGFRRRVAELVASLACDLLLRLGELGALAGALNDDLLVDAEGEQLGRAAADGWPGSRAGRVGESALGEQGNGLGEVLVAEAEQVLDPELIAGRGPRRAAR